MAVSAIRPTSGIPEHDFAGASTTDTDRILDAAHDAFVSMDAEGSITRWNRAAEATFGWPSSDAVGRSLAEVLVPERLRAAHREGLARIVAGGEARVLGQRLELTALHRDGHELPVELTIARVQTDGVQSFHAFLHDISDRRRAEDLRAVQQQAATTIAASPPLEDAALTILGILCERTGWDVGGVWILDERSDRLRVLSLVDASASAAVFITASRELALARGTGLPGRVWASRQLAWIIDIPPDLNFARSEAAAQAGLTAGVCQPIFSGERFVGALELFRRAPLPEVDTHLGEVLATVCGQLGEFVARKRAEAELARSNRELESFASVASHDLSEPLRIVGGYAELLQEHLADSGDAEVQTYLSALLRGTARMHAMIDSLLSYSRIDGEQLEPQPVDSATLASEVLETLAAAIDEQGATVTVGELPVVQGDATQLAQLLQNLVANALKFTAEGRPPRIEIRGERRTQAWELSVIDDGIGIDPKDRERIFEPFTRGNARRRYPGSGIGLATCRKVVQRHGGRIWMEPTPGGGSTFRFTIADAPGEG